MHDRPVPVAASVRSAVPAVAVPDRTEEPLTRRSDALGFACDFDAAWLRFTQRSLAASLRHGWIEDVHPEDRARCLSIHAEMRASRAPYSLDYRLRHAGRTHRWVMEQAIPVLAPDGRFDGFAHHCADIHDRHEVAERLADQMGRLRASVRHHAAFAAALATDFDRLPPARVKVALEIFAELVGHPGRPQGTRCRVAEWLGHIAEAAGAALPPGTAPIALTVPGEPLAFDFDTPLLRAALVHALVCAALAGAAAPQVRAEQVDHALLLELPAGPGSSAFVLLELVLRAHGLSGGQSVGKGSTQRWRVALPLAACAGR